MMQAGYILLFSIFPIVLEGCCGGDYRRRQTDLQQEMTQWLYKVVEGENFTMRCYKNFTVWSKTGKGRGGHEDTSFDCGKVFVVGVKHSGNYTSLNGGSSSFLYLQVVEKISLVNLGCFQPKESQVGLVNMVGGDITCPGHKCSNNTDVQWSMASVTEGTTSVSKTRSSCVKNGVLHLCEVKSPFDNRRSHNLTCEVFFTFETNMSAQVLWYVSYSGNDENMTLLPMGEPQVKDATSTTSNERGIIRTAFIKEVTQQHLSYTYTCVANVVPWPSVVGGPVVSLVLVAGLGIVVHMKWLELKIIYRSHFPFRKHEEEEKNFDVFLSYVWSAPPPEEEGGSGAGAEEEVYTNDVALAIQRSQMLICLLSADYLCNNSAVFVLETGVQALLQNSAFKILLIRTNRGSAAPLSQQDPPLPTLVQRALKVLPSLNWTSGRPARATCNFWRSLRKAMPDDRVKLMSQKQEQG
ncbi:hypothetical protein INR49_004175 [Caranx melampygus]|nr:hypothetical protein INR49_004175 [Caranx melampygus]